ncbi:hypothetical protein LR48_Vigan09g045700 [Vigna angularis]|uniref:Transposase (putative) gypsy type domain-containing protein n=1 Tax=Phaseolus angularis TaxID=3914 RepID=A0A0L9V9X2_PHAAN|nr:hypothetical protein LR48_Vigan09g045700 [Vigna angularis]
MVVVHVESSLESSGSSGGRSMGGDGERGSSPSSVLSSFLEESARSLGPEPNSPTDADKRIIFGIPIHLLKGGIPVDDAPLELDGVIVENRSAVQEDSRLIQAGVSLRNERVYHGKGSSSDNFFFMYANFFDQLCIRVPLTEFQMAVLQVMNVAPAQLHPNAWAAVHAFLAMCSAIGITPTIPVFFHYFDVRSLPTCGWVSLTSVKDRTIFRPFSDSYKNFKNQFFKIIIDEVGRHEFHDVAGNPLFPFYWTRNPKKIKAYSVGKMNPVDLEVVRTINDLPRRLSAHNFVECLRHEDYIMSAPPHRKSNFMASRKGARGSSSSIRERVALTTRRPPLIKRASSTSRTPTVPPAVSKGSSAINVGSLLLREASPHRAFRLCSWIPLLKRPPLPPNPLLRIGRGTKRGRDSPPRKGARRKKGPPPNRPLRREFADHKGADDVRAVLLAEKKVSKDLRAAIEQMLMAQDESDKKNDELQAKVDEVKEELVDATNQLRDTREDYDRLLEECGQLKAKEMISELEVGIVFEHEEGFNKALRQASILIGVKESFALGFDIENGVFDGVLVPLKLPAIEEHPPVLENAEAVEQGTRTEDEEIGDAERAIVADDGDDRGAE